MMIMRIIIILIIIIITITIIIIIMTTIMIMIISGRVLFCRQMHDLMSLVLSVDLSARLDLEYVCCGC